MCWLFSVSTLFFKSRHVWLLRRQRKVMPILGLFGAVILWGRTPENELRISSMMGVTHGHIPP